MMLAMGLLLASTPESLAQWKTAWSYHGPRGPSHWGALDPDYALCGSGKAQSPIDIEKARKAPLPALSFDYKKGPLHIVNNGYTAVRVDYPPGNGNFLMVGGKRYELTQFHFHHPSEEKIHGRTFDMVLHLMHRAEDGEVAGVAVLMRKGKANAAIARLWRDMPKAAGDEHMIDGAGIDLQDLIPQGSGYYAYTGSLTAPPCTEGVKWFVLKRPITVSAQEIEAFARLYPHDVRPVQSLNGRVVEESP